MATSRILSVRRRGEEPPFHLFIDETRIRDHFCLTGCVTAREAHHDQIHMRFEAMKICFFPQLHTSISPIVFHRKEITNGDPPFRFLKDQQREDFHRGLLDVLRKADFKVIVGIAAFNRCLEKRYQTVDAYCRCLRFLLSRYAGYLCRLGTRGDVYAEHVAPKEDEFLKSEYSRVRNIDGAAGEDPRYFRDVLTSKDLHIEDKKKNIAGLQVADLLAAPLMRKFLSADLGKQFDMSMAQVGESKLIGAADGDAVRVL